MSDTEIPTFYCVANKRIIGGESSFPSSYGRKEAYTGEALLKLHDNNRYDTEKDAVDAAKKLSHKYTSEFFVLKAIKRVRREPPPTEVVTLIDVAPEVVP